MSEASSEDRQGSQTYVPAVKGREIRSVRFDDSPFGMQPDGSFRYQRWGTNGGVAFSSAAFVVEFADGAEERAWVDLRRVGSRWVVVPPAE